MVHSLTSDSSLFGLQIETTSIPGKIHLSDFTAELLKKSGRGKWLTPRADKVSLAGKGDMQTYYLLDHRDQDKGTNRSKHSKPIDGMVAITEASEASETFSPDREVEACFLSKNQRLVEWNTEVLSQLLQQILAARTVVASASAEKIEKGIGEGQIVLEEFQEIVVLPKYSSDELQKRRDTRMIELDPKVKDQLRDFVTKVSAMYRNNAFHSFEHASHVVASVSKLLTRIVAGSSTGNDLGLVDRSGNSFGITSDPLTQFAVVFSALIHDGK